MTPTWPLSTPLPAATCLCPKRRQQFRCLHVAEQGSKTRLEGGVFSFYLVVHAGVMYGYMSYRRAPSSGVCMPVSRLRQLLDDRFTTDRCNALRCAALRYNVMLLIRSTWRRQVVGCRHLQVTEVAVAGRAAEGLRTTTARPGTIAKNNKDGDGCR